jgi:hypothetical protein
MSIGPATKGCIYPQSELENAQEVTSLTVSFSGLPTRLFLFYFWIDTIFQSTILNFHARTVEANEETRANEPSCSTTHQA